MPDVRADKVSEISGVDALNVLLEHYCQVMIVLARFLSINDNNCPSPVTSLAQSICYSRDVCMILRYINFCYLSVCLSIYLSIWPAASSYRHCLRRGS